MGTPDLDAAGAADLAQALNSARVCAASASAAYSFCTADSLNEGASLQPAVELSQFTESWSMVLTGITKDLLAASQLFGGLARELDRLDSSIVFE